MIYGEGERNENEWENTQEIGKTVGWCKRWRKMRTTHPCSAPSAYPTAFVVSVATRRRNNYAATKYCRQRVRGNRNTSDTDGKRVVFIDACRVAAPGKNAY